MIGGALHSAAGSRLLYLIALLVGSVAYFSVANPFFGDVQNFKGIGAGAASLGIVAVGVTLALGAGAIDFSVAGNIAFTGVLVSWLAERTAASLAIVAALAAATAVGALNGLIVVRFRVNPFIATLAMAGSLRGLGFVLTGSSAGILVSGGALATLGQKSSLGVPHTLIALLVTTAAGLAVLRLTPFGRNLLAVGGNPEAARLSGVAVDHLQISGYLISAFSAGLGGVLLAGRSGAGLPQAASGQELLIFSAVILGGTSLWGGRASVMGTLFGILFLNVLYNGLALEQVSAYWQTVVQGVLLITAVWLVRQQEQRRGPTWLLSELWSIRGVWRRRAAER
jgi:ribose/xylose/arabinose/galactoside ABC-type transport system permease subunit